MPSLSLKAKKSEQNTLVAGHLRFLNTREAMSDSLWSNESGPYNDVAAAVVAAVVALAAVAVAAASVAAAVAFVVVVTAAAAAALQRFYAVLHSIQLT